MPVSFDKKITDKIRETFESYDEPFNEHAWDLMKDRLSKNKKRGFVWMINIAKAASVILFVGLSIMIPHTISDQKADNEIFPVLKDTFNNNTVNPDSGQNYYVAEDYDKDVIVKNMQSIESNSEDIQTAESNNNFRGDDQIRKMVTNPEENKKKIIIAENLENTLTDTIKKNNEIDSVKSKSKKPILGPNTDDFIKKEKRDKKVQFGIALSSHMTSSEIGANDFLNVGGGFLTEYVLSKHISVSSGLYVSNHNLDTDNSFFNFSMKDEADHVYASVDNSIPNASNQMYSTSKQVAIVGLDIPLNLNYNFNKLYISAGVSSLIYLRENLTENFVVENSKEIFNSSNNTYETVYMYDNMNNTTKAGALRTFDFAKLFNISIGYKIPLKKGRLIFEPYAKIPIGKLTSYNISYGYGGFSIKYNF